MVGAFGDGADLAPDSDPRSGSRAVPAWEKGKDGRSRPKSTEVCYCRPALLFTLQQDPPSHDLLVNRRCHNLLLLRSTNRECLLVELPLESPLFCEASGNSASGTPTTHVVLWDYVPH